MQSLLFKKRDVVKYPFFNSQFSILNSQFSSPHSLQALLQLLSGEEDSAFYRSEGEF